MNVGFRIPSKVDAEPAERLFDLRQYLNFVWRNWVFIVSVTAFVFLIGCDPAFARDPALHRDNPSPACSSREISSSNGKRLDR